MDDRSETSGIVNPAVEILNKMPGVWAMRVNSGGYRGRMRGAPAGTADIFCCADGQTFFFEAKKSDKEKLSEPQKKFSDLALRAGARFFVIYNKLHPKEIIDEWRSEKRRSVL